jgi:Ni,Fe-hydrogenase I cytochrome b subunit
MKRLNEVLTVAAVIITGLWIWKWFFTPEGRMARGSYRGMPMSRYLSLSIIIVCAGYLLWRFMAYIYWKKYFGDDEPPDEPHYRL